MTNEKEENKKVNSQEPKKDEAADNIKQDTASVSSDEKDQDIKKEEKPTSDAPEAVKNESAKGTQNAKSSRYAKTNRSTGANKDQKDDEAPEFIEKVIAINRITKVTKGGKKLSFSVLSVVGDTKGKVGYSLEKAGEVAIAIRKSIVVAKKNMIEVPLKGTTIPHEIIGQCSGSRVLLKPAAEGTGVIASGPVRAVCDGAGIHNILTKCHRSNNPINVVKATIEGLSRLKTAKKE